MNPVTEKLIAQIGDPQIAVLVERRDAVGPVTADPLRRLSQD
jgi:hypothetical protein